MSKVVYIKGQEDLNKVLGESKAVLVDFFADWCPPCKKLGEQIESVISSGNGWIVAKINIDEDDNQPIAEAHGVQGIPQVNLYLEGKNEQKFVGFNQNKLTEFITLATDKCK